jgi:hypothetical protein
MGGGVRMADLVPVIEQIKAEFAEAKQKIADNGGWDVGDFKDIYEAFVGIVVAVETAAAEVGGMTESEKKEAVSSTLNWMVDLPWIPEAMEDMAFDLIVNIVWEAAKAKLGGKEDPVEPPPAPPA